MERETLPKEVDAVLENASGIAVDRSMIVGKCQERGCQNRKLRQYRHCRFHLTLEERRDMMGGR